MDRSKRDKLSKFYKRSAQRCEKFELPLVKRSFACHFLETSLTDKERLVHQELKKQLVPDCLQQNIVVPKNIAEKDARKALKLLKLQHDSSWSFHVTWEARPTKKTVITEKPPRS